MMAVTIPYYASIEERVTADGFGNLEPYLFYGGPLSMFSRHTIRLPDPFTGRLRIYPTGEHRFQAMKAGAKHHHEWVLAARTPSEAKARGRSIPLRDGWGSDYGDLCWYVMHEVALMKTLQHGDVRRVIAASGQRPIYEDSPTDDIWGVRTGATFGGKNLLGRCYMRVRSLFAHA